MKKIENKPVVFSLLGLLWFMLSLFWSAYSDINVLVTAFIIGFAAVLLVWFVAIFIICPWLFIKWALNEILGQDVKAKELQRQMNRSGGHD